MSTDTDALGKPGDPPVGDGVNAPNTTATAPSPNYSATAVWAMFQSMLKSSSLKLLTQPCNRLWENCSLEGCTTTLTPKW